MSDDMTVERVQALITRGPYNQWLGLKVIAVHDDGAYAQSAAADGEAAPAAEAAVAASILDVAAFRQIVQAHGLVSLPAARS